MTHFRFQIFKARESFTLVEMLVSIAIFSVLLGVAVSNINNASRNEKFDADARLIADAFSFTQSKARLGENGTSWGMKFSSAADGSGYYEIYSGASYESAMVARTQLLSNASRFTNPAPGKTKTYIFTVLAGLPGNTNSVAIRMQPFNGRVYVVSVSSLGKVGLREETGLMGLWPLDEAGGTSTYDESGNGFQGTLQNFPFSGNDRWVTLARSGSGLSFGGASSTVNLGAALNPENAMTFMAWVYQYSISGEQKLIDKQISTSSVNGFSVYMNNGRLSFSFGDGSTGTDNGKTISGYKPGVWYHVAVTRSGTTVTYYLNGSSLGTGTVPSGNIASNNYNLSLGYSLAGNRAGLNGMIDDVRLYDRVLTPTEIQNIYESY